MKQNSSLIKDFDFYILILQLIFLSFGAVFHKFAPVMFYGVSIFLIVIPYLLMFYIFLKNYNKISIYDLEFLGVLLFCAILLIFLRSMVYKESFIKSFSGDIYILFIPITFLIYKNLSISLMKFKLIRKFVLIVILCNCLNSILYILGLSYFETQFEDSESYILFSRFSGLFGGPNISSNAVMLLTIIYLLTADKFNVAAILLLSFIFLITVLPNLSRGPLLIYTLFLVSFIIFNFKNNVINIFLIFFSFFIFVSIFLYLLNYSALEVFFNSLLERLEELDGKYGRLDRLILTINLLFENFLSFVIGIRGSNQTINEDFSISDNSLTLFLANLGFPLTLFLCFLIVRYINSFNILNGDKIIYTFVIITTGVFNNAVLWTVWSLYVIIGYKLLSVKNKGELNHKVSQ